VTPGFSQPTAKLPPPAAGLAKKIIDVFEPVLSFEYFLVTQYEVTNS
jgi:hypothetical protein